MKSNNKAVYLLALLLFAGGLGYLVFTGLSEDSVYFVNVSEALAMEPSKLESARLFGTVDSEGIETAQGSLGVRFRLLDKDDAAKAIVVNYSGAVPDTFKPGVEVIVEGGMRPGEAVFSAGTLMTKCPSKYEKQREDERRGG